MSILDKLAKAFGFKSDDDLKKKQEKEESKDASKKESVDQYHKDLTFDWELALKHRKPVTSIDAFHIGKADYNALLLVAKNNKFSFEDEYFQYVEGESDEINEDNEQYKSLLKRFTPGTSGIVCNTGWGNMWVLNWKEKKFYYFDHEDFTYKEAWAENGKTFEQFMSRCKYDHDDYVERFCK
jgi:hypothetical protein